MDLHERPPAERGPWASVGFTLSQLGFETSRRFATLVGALGLEPRHFALLRAAGDAGGHSQQTLADMLRIPPSTMVSLVDHLEKSELLERRPHPLDRRSHTLHLTGKGATLLQQALELGAEQEQRVCRGLTPEEREHLLSMLARVAANLGLGPKSLPDEGSGRRPEPLS